MTDAHEGATLRIRLEEFGDPCNTWKWETGEVDYVAQLAVTSGNVPELLAIAQKWVEPQTDWPDDKDYVAGYAPVHAWRCLAQLGAVEAVGPLLEMMDPLDAVDDDWYLEEFPPVLAWIGQAAFGPLSVYLADDAHEVYPRIAVARALSLLAQRHPQIRAGVISVLCDTLGRFEENDESLNAFLISHLLELKATGAAELIERAHAADRVDLMVNGNWNEVRKELGVEGLGLVPEHLAGRRPFPFFSPPPLDDGGRDDVPPGVAAIPFEAPKKKVGRNEPCPCGSGKKHKKCCGR